MGNEKYADKNSLIIQIIIINANSYELYYSDLHKCFLEDITFEF